MALGCRCVGLEPVKMLNAREKQSHSQPIKCEEIKVGTEDSFYEGPGGLMLESALLLAQDLELEEEEEE